MLTYVGWGFGGLVVACVVYGILGAIAEKIIEQRDLGWHREQEVMCTTGRVIWLIVFPVCIGFSLWQGPLYTAAIRHERHLRWEAYLDSLQYWHVTVIGSELAIGSYSSGRNSVASSVYGIHVMTEEFPTQKILVREHLGVMDVCKGERLAVWLDGWVAVKVKRLDAPSHSLEK